MAKLGLKYFVYATYSASGTTVTYSNGAALAKAISVNTNIQFNNVKLHGSDEVAESDRSFSSGTVEINATDLPDAARVALLGYAEGATIDASSGAKELSLSGTATVPYVGFGFYGKRVVDGVNSWRAIWIRKVQFSEPSDEMATKGETLTFGSHTISGEVMEAADGDVFNNATFDTEAEAIAYLNTKSGISSAASNNITVLSITNGTLTPTFAEATRNYSCECTGNIDLTATFAAGTAKVYVDGVYTETLVTTVKGGTITMAAGNNKIVQIVVQESGKSPITYTIMAQRAAG